MKVSTVGKSLTLVERAYIAGFLDGDGAIMATIERHQEKRFGFRVRVTIKITQYHKKDVAWLVNTVGIGYIRMNRRTYEWIVRDQESVQWFLRTIATYSRCKEKQIRIALKILQTSVHTQRDLVAIARLADTLSFSNVRSKNRRKNFAAMIAES